MISPLDGRYKKQTRKVDEIFNERNTYRLYYNLELLYLSSFLKHSKKCDHEFEDFPKWEDAFYDDIKLLEKTTNHDIGAVVKFIKEKICNEFTILDGEKMSNFVHLGLTSSDIKCLAEAIQIAQAQELVYNQLEKIRIESINLRQNYGREIFPTFTHGQLATPCHFDDYLSNLFEPLYDTIRTPINIGIKVGGANGNLTSLQPIFNDEKYQKNLMTEDFTNSINDHYNLSLEEEFYTTQVPHYTQTMKYISSLEHLSLKGIQICQTMWGLNSHNLIIILPKKGEIGSSTMPHKVNPIAFENAEGNFKMVISLCRILNDSMGISRMHRDLSGSTIQRNFGVLFGHLIVAMKNLKNGLKLIAVNPSYNIDRPENEILLMEYYSTIFQFLGNEDGYNICKLASRGNQDFSIDKFIRSNIELILELESKGFKILTKPSEYVEYWEKQ